MPHVLESALWQAQQASCFAGNRPTSSSALAATREDQLKIIDTDQAGQLLHVADDGGNTYNIKTGEITFANGDIFYIRGNDKQFLDAIVVKRIAGESSGIDQILAPKGDIIGVLGRQTQGMAEAIDKSANAALNGLNVKVDVLSGGLCVPLIFLDPTGVTENLQTITGHSSTSDITNLVDGKELKHFLCYGQNSVEYVDMDKSPARGQFIVPIGTGATINPSYIPFS